MGIRITGYLFFFAFAAFWASCHSHKTGAKPAFKDLAPVVMDKKGAEIFQYWEFKDDPSLWAYQLGQVAGLQSYRDSLKRELGKEAFKLAVQKEASQNSPYYVKDQGNGDQINAQLVHSGAAGKIRPINFLEAELLNYQLDRYPLLSHPTEFHGFILSHDSLGQVRVYFAASDQPWPPKPSVILDALESDLKEGWDFKYHLHNHYEPKANNYVGILAPSLADAQFFVFLANEFHLGKALITNGFHTVEIRRDEFQKFRSHGN